MTSESELVPRVSHQVTASHQESQHLLERKRIGIHRGKKRCEVQVWYKNISKYFRWSNCISYYWYISTSSNMCGLKRRPCSGIGWWAGIRKLSLNATDVTSDSTRGNWVIEKIQNTNPRNRNKDIWYLSVSSSKGWFWMTGRKVANIEQ